MLLSIELMMPWLKNFLINGLLLVLIVPEIFLNSFIPRLDENSICVYHAMDARDSFVKKYGL